MNRKKLERIGQRRRRLGQKLDSGREKLQTQAPNEGVLDERTDAVSCNGDTASGSRQSSYVQKKTKRDGENRRSACTFCRTKLDELNRQAADRCL